jgi:3-oxoadipate enol-lactonase
MSALHFEVRGDGPAVLFLHPGIADSGVWEPQWEAYTGFTLVRCDLPGFGRSPLGTGPVRAAHDVAELLDELGLGGAGVVGCSYGARVALELAVGRPDLVRALVLVGASFPGRPWSQAIRDFGAAEEEALERADIDAAVELNVHTWFDGPHRGPDDVDPAKRAEVARMCRRGFENQIAYPDLEEELLVPDLDQRLADVRQPALVLVGDQDVDDIVSAAPLLVDALRDASSATIAGAAHIPSLEQPEAFDALVLPFLGRSSSLD